MDMLLDPIEIIKSRIYAILSQLPDDEDATEFMIHSAAVEIAAILGR